MIGSSNAILPTKSSQVETNEPFSLVRKWRDGEEKKQWVGTLFFGAMMLFAVRTIMSVCALEISKEFNYDKSQMATLLSSFFYGYPLTQVLGGFISDRIGGDIVIYYAAIFWSVATLFLPYVSIISDDKYKVLAYITLIRCITGAFQGFHYPGTSSLVSKRIAESEKSFTFSFITSGQHLGTLFCGIVGSVVLETYGWRATFQMVGLMCLAWTYYYRNYVVLKSRANLSLFNTRDGHPRGDDESSREMAKEKVNPDESVPWNFLLRQTPFWAVIMAHICQNNAYYILLTWLPTYFQENYPGSKGWIFNVVPWIISLPSTIFAGWFADRLISQGHSITSVRKMTACVSLCGCGFFFMLISQTESYSMALFLMACAVACCGFHNAGIMVNPQDLAPKFAGSVFGVMNTLGALPGFFGVKFAGYILQTTKSWAIVFNQTGALCFIGFIVFLMFGTGKKIV